MQSLLISLVLIILCPWFASPVSAHDSAVVFMYHRFGEDRYPSTSIRMDQFRQQMKYLHENGFTVIPLSLLIAGLLEDKTLPPKAVVITVDDAYRSVHDLAYPLLSDYGFPLTVFVSTDALDKNLPGFMSWDQLREMAGHGVEFANHGAGHISMIEHLPGETQSQWQQRVVADIEKGKHRLRQELPGTLQLLPNAFAYPYGEYDTNIARLVTELGYVAFGQQSGAIGRLSDRRALPRFPMAEAFAQMSGFSTKAMSLPLPVTDVFPWDPVTENPIPEITLTLADSDAALDGLACYVNGRATPGVDWLEPGRRFRVKPQEALGKGRQRVNCTAPRGDGRYFWFSHQWVVH